MKTIGIFIFNDAEELDFVGPYEVFTMINEIFNYRGEADGVKVILISEDGQDIIGKKGMRVGAHAAMSDIDKLDVVLVPGGSGSRTQLHNVSVLSWLKALAPSCEWVTSVCTGSFILAKAGLTKDKRITTHQYALAEFEKLGLEGHLIKDVRYVRDGNIVTSAGVSAGIDMALWLTGQMFNPTFARSVQRGMQYDPAPPYQAQV